MGIRNINQISTGVLILLIASVLCVSCMSGLNRSSVGRVVPPEKRIALAAGGENAHSWSAYDLTVNFVYQRNPDTIKIKGETIFDKHLAYNFSAIDYFYMRGYFLDDDGTVLAQVPLVTAGHVPWIETIAFDRTFSIPPGTAWMAFGYRGRAYEGGSRLVGSGLERSGDGVDWLFSYSPF